MNTFGYYLLLFTVTRFAFASISSSLFSCADTTAVVSPSHGFGALPAVSHMASALPSSLPATLESPFISSEFPSALVDSLKCQVSIVATGGTHTTSATVMGLFGYPLFMTRTTIVTLRVTGQVTTTLITIKGPFGYPLPMPMPSPTFVTLIEPTRVTDTVTLFTHETSSSTPDQSTRRSNIIFGVIGIILACGALVVRVLQLVKKTHNLALVEGRHSTKHMSTPPRSPLP